MTELEVEPFLSVAAGPRISYNLKMLAVELEKIQEMMLFINSSIFVLYVSGEK